MVCLPLQFLSGRSPYPWRFLMAQPNTAEAAPLPSRTAISCPRRQREFMPLHLSRSRSRLFFRRLHNALDNFCGVARFVACGSGQLSRRGSVHPHSAGAGSDRASDSIVFRTKSSSLTCSTRKAARPAVGSSVAATNAHARTWAHLFVAGAALCFPVWRLRRRRRLHRFAAEGANRQWRRGWRGRGLRPEAREIRSHRLQD